VRRELDSLVGQMYAGGITYAEAVREFKKRFLLEVLHAHRGNQCKAAKDLKVHRNTLSRMVAELGIEQAEMRPGMKRPPRSERPMLEAKRTGSDLR
jgi:Fis family transcriptional regulator